jgi:hypothetical protein
MFFHIVCVAGAIYVSVMPICSFVLNMSRVDSNTPSLFFGGRVNVFIVARLSTTSCRQGHGDCCRQRCFTMVNVTNSTNVDVWFIPFKLFACHLRYVSFLF